MKIAIHGHTFNKVAVPFIQEMFDCLESRGAELQVSRSYDKFLQENGITRNSEKTFTDRNDLFDADFICSIGGDGTLLETITYIGARETPILGINAGRLGFLATTPRDRIMEAVDAIFNGYYDLDRRSLLRLDSDEQVFGEINFALNEFTILKRDSSSMIVVHTYINGEYLNSYWADGLIVSTPTGSTGYSLSVGGPLVLPHSSNFIIAPVSPHNLNVRPMVVSDNSVISFEVESRTNSFLVSMDSRSETVDTKVQLAVRKESFSALLVKLNGYNFLDTLRNKLHWGMDARN